MIRFTQKKYDRLRCKFDGAEKIEKSHSQAYQEMFVLSMLNGKRNGTYLEVGAYHSSRISNTWILEKQFGWDGLSLDISKKCVDDWKENRTGKFLLGDATKLDYDVAMKDAGLGPHVDFLQLDIDPCQVTFAALMQISFDKYTFSVITFEHELFRREKEIHVDRVREESRKYITSKGYVMVAGDVAGAKGKPFEDWYVSKEIAESDFFKEHFSINPEFNDLGENYILHP